MIFQKKKKITLIDITRLKEITQRSEQHKLYLCLVS